METIIGFIAGWFFGCVLCQKYGHRFTMIGVDVKVWFKRLIADIKKRINKIK